MNLLHIDIADEQTNEIFPQVLHMGSDYDFEAPNAVTRITSNEPLSFAPNLNSFHLDRDTNHTDIISQAYIYTLGLLVSGNLYEAIRNHSLQPLQAYPAQVVYRNTSHQYRWLHVTERLEPFLDFANSEFFEKDIDGTVTPVILSNVSDLRAKSKSIVATISSSLSANKIRFLPNVPAYDLFFLDLVPRLIFISDALRDVLLKRRFTGFVITPSPIEISFG